MKKATPNETELRSKSFNEKEFYKEKITKLVEKIENPTILKRIYQLAEYLYIQKVEEE